VVLLALVRKDLQRAAADRRAVIVNLLLPLLLSFVMGLSFGGGFFGRGGPTRVPLVLVGEGVPQVLRDRVADALGQGDFFAATWADSAEADRRVREGDAVAAVVLPRDAAKRFFSGDSLQVALWQDPGSPVTSAIVEQILDRLLARYQAGEAAYLALWPEDGFEAARGDGDRQAWRDLFDGGLSEAWRRWRSPGGDPELRRAAEQLARTFDHNAALGRAMSEPTVVLADHDKAAAAAAGPKANLYDTILPGFAVFFLMFAAAAAGRDLHRERDRGTLQRQLLSPVGAGTFVAAKWLSATLQGVLQLAALLMAGGLLFGMNLGPDGWSLPALVVLGSAAAAAFFLLIGVLTPTEKIMDNLSTVVVLVSAMLGGNMIPSDALPAWVRLAGRVTFNSWLNEGLADVISRDRSLAAAPLPAAVLAGVAAAALVAAVLVFGARRRRGGLR